MSNEILTLCKPENRIKKFKPVITRLVPYGFTKEKAGYIYHERFEDDQFDAVIVVKDGKIFADVIDLDTDEAYLPLRVKVKTGGFVNEVRAAFEQIIARFGAACCIDLSHKNKKKGSESGAWLIPSNPKHYSVRGAYLRDETMIWHQNVAVHPGDDVFIYITQPFSAILYRCTAIDTDISREGKKPAMALKFARAYPVEYAVDLLQMRRVGVGAVRGQRSVPQVLYDMLMQLEKRLDEEVVQKEASNHDK